MRDDFEITKFIIQTEERMKLMLVRIEELESFNRVLIKHIDSLDSKNKSFFDNFKFGRFRFTPLEKKLGHLPKERSTFTLNDD